MTKRVFFMKSFTSPTKGAVNRANGTVQRVDQPSKTIVDNRPSAVAQRRLHTAIHTSPPVRTLQRIHKGSKSTMRAPIQLMKKWTSAGGFETITAAPEDSTGLASDGTKLWIKYKYKNEELYLKSDDMTAFPVDEWEHMDIDEEDMLAEEVAKSEQEQVEDKFPDKRAGDVTSITIIKESKTDHQYVIAMVKGGPNIKMHYGTGGGLIKSDNDIDNAHGVPVSNFDVPVGLTGDMVREIFSNTRKSIQSRFRDGNCGGLASELVGRLGGVNKEKSIFD